MKESSIDYLERKRHELDYINSQLNRPLTLDPVLGPGDVWSAKIRLKGALYSEWWQRHAAYGETSGNGQSIFNLIGSQLKYGYQRYDIELAGRPFHEPIYDFAQADVVSTGFYTASGMSAIQAALTAVEHLGSGTTQLILQNDCYFETKVLAETYHDRLCLDPNRGVSTGPQVLYLDSIGIHDTISTLSRADLQGVDVVVLDTTCYGRENPLLKKIVDGVLAEDKVLILVRSHIKLDSLALEYGRLGSLCIVLSPWSAPSTRKLAGRLRAVTRDYLSKTGGFFQPQNLLPFSHQPKFHELNRQRVARLKWSNKWVASALASSFSGALTSYHHGLFLTVDYGSSRKGWQESPKALFHQLDQVGLAPMLAPGFGFDRIAIDSFIDMRNQSPVVRIAFPDLPASLLQRAVKVIEQHKEAA